ncbi:efflux RND transporter periplasmic adaptor subunit [Tumidithrix helvetica PCC 7403]|uniref:efflux RND transporter periplasmic adaptor subunit n=1 Tax=Tumidithrix helvetica TaxID=3457545 RepID=UPI003CC1EAC9
MRHPIFSALLLISVLIGSPCLLTACGTSQTQSDKAGKDEKKAVLVVLAVAKRQSIPLLVQTTGVVQAYATVSVKSQIAGQLVEVYFKEGQDVSQGDRLFTIDPRLLEANLANAIANRDKAAAQVAQAQAQVGQAQAQVLQAQANVARDVAQAKNATRQAERYTGLQKQGVISQNQAEQFTSTAESQQAIVVASQSNVGNAIAAVDSAEANLENARAALNSADAVVESVRVQLTYTAIFAPIDGRVGKLNVDRGNLVKDNDTNPLVVISQITPIYVEFSVPQRLLPEIKKYQAQKKLTVEANPPQDSGKPAQGELVFVDSTVDAATGTIKLKAQFANPLKQLTPGQFVNVKLKLAEKPNAIAVPTIAIQTGQKGTFVYVIKSDQTVEMRPVTTGTTVDNLIAVEKGLEDGERVVIDGQFNLSPGVLVKEQEKGKEEKGKEGKEEKGKEKEK